MCLQHFSSNPERFKPGQDWSISTQNQFALMKLMIGSEAGMVGSAWLDVDSGPIYCGEKSGPSETVWERGGKSRLDLEITEGAVGQTAQSQMLASSTLPHIK